MLVIGSMLGVFDSQRVLGSFAVVQTTKLGYQTWAFGIYILLTSLKGAASMKSHRDLSVTQKEVEIGKAYAATDIARGIVGRSPPDKELVA